MGYLYREYEGRKLLLAAATDLENQHNQPAKQREADTNSGFLPKLIVVVIVVAENKGSRRNNY